MLWAVIGVFAVSVGIAYHCRVEFSQAVSVFPMAIALILYGFYIADHLYAGFLFVWFTIILTVIRMIVKSIICGNFPVRKILMQPAVMIWIVCICFIICITENDKVSLWDDFRMWGGYTKALFYTGHIQLGDDSLIFSSMRSNIPGMPLFCFFFELSNGEFKEHLLFAAYGLFSVSVLCSGLTNLRQAWTIPVFSAVVYYLPKIFYNPRFEDYQIFYQSLFVDPIVGLLFGFLLYQLFEGAFENRFRAVRFACTCMMITLVKESGAAFALLAAGAALLYDYRESSRDGAKRTISWYGIRLLPVLGVAAVYVSWFVSCRRYEVERMVSMSDALLFDRGFLKEFLATLTCGQYIDSLFTRLKTGYSFLEIYIILLVAGGILYRISGMSVKKKLRLTFITMHVSSFVFTAGLYYTCLRGYGKQMLSYNRYLSTLTTGILVVMFFIVMNEKGRFCNIRQTDKFVTAVIAVIFISIIPLRSNVGYDPATTWGWTERVDDDTRTIVSALRDCGAGEGSNIYLFVDGWEQGADWVHHRMYFNMLGSGYTIKNYWPQATVTAAEGEDLTDKKQRFVDDLKSGDYDYLICEGYDSDENLKSREQYASLLGEEIHGSSIWRIHTDGVSLSLEQLR